MLKVARGNHHFRHAIVSFRVPRPINPLRRNEEEHRLLPCCSSILAFVFEIYIIGTYMSYCCHNTTRILLIVCNDRIMMTPCVFRTRKNFKRRIEKRPRRDAHRLSRLDLRVPILLTHNHLSCLLFNHSLYYRLYLSVYQSEWNVHYQLGHPLALLPALSMRKCLRFDSFWHQSWQMDIICTARTL
jgi:hypothetical protein